MLHPDPSKPKAVDCRAHENTVYMYIDTSIYIETYTKTICGLQNENLHERWFFSPNEVTIDAK